MTQMSGSSSVSYSSGSFRSTTNANLYLEDAAQLVPDMGLGFGSAYNEDGKGKKMVMQGSHAGTHNTIQPTLNDLNPPTTSSQLQYSPTMSLKGGKGTNKVNIMASPVQIKLSEPPSARENKNSRASKSKKNGANGKNEMVFVNYSVQDTVENQKKKKQSKRDRMLRIFTGSNNSNAAISKGISTPQSSGSSSSTMTLPAQPQLPHSAPASATKRNYASFLKYHRSSSNSTPTQAESFAEVVPKSEPIPNGQKPALTRSASSSVALIRNNRRCSLSQSAMKLGKSHEHFEKMDLLKFNVAKNSGSGSASSQTPPNYLHRSKSNSNSELRRVPTGSMDASTTSSIPSASSLSNIPTPTMARVYNPKQQFNPDEEEFDHHYLEPYQEYDNFSSSASLQPSGDTPDSLSTFFTDENDASVAFSKLFTRKRTNTGGSISSTLSLQATQPAFPHLDRNPSNNSVPSFRHSPIRSSSQSRTRSNTRNSSQRLSRDLTTLQLSLKNSSGDSSDGPGMESFLDTHSKSGRLSHRKKQESISDMAKYHNSQGTMLNYASANSTTSMSSSSSTPGTTESTLMQFSKPSQQQQQFSVQRENSLENDLADEEEQFYFKPVIREDEEYESAINTSASSSHMGVSSTTTISTRQTAPEIAEFKQPFSTSNVTKEEGQSIYAPKKNSAGETMAENKQTGWDQPNELFNNYIDFNYEEIPSSQFLNENGNLLHQVFNSNNDTSTITSGMNISPITITGANTSQDEVASFAPKTHQVYNSNLSFQSRVMNDIDRLAHGFNISDFPNEKVND